MVGFKEERRRFEEFQQGSEKKTELNCGLRDFREK